MKSRNVMSRGASNKNNNILASKLELNIQTKAVKYCIWSIGDGFETETWTLRKLEKGG
jgi:hypothetical protein